MPERRIILTQTDLRAGLYRHPILQPLSHPWDAPTEPVIACETRLPAAGCACGAYTFEPEAPHAADGCCELCGTACTRTDMTVSPGPQAPPWAALALCDWCIAVVHAVEAWLSAADVHIVSREEQQALVAWARTLDWTPGDPHG
jgi:hypothetical protein